MEGEKKTPFSIWPTDDEVIYFKNNSVTPSDFFHQSFKWMSNGQRYNWMKDVNGYLLMMLLGLSLFALSYLMIALIPKVIMILSSVAMIFYGCLAILMERRNNAGRVRHSST